MDLFTNSSAIFTTFRPNWFCWLGLGLLQFRYFQLSLVRSFIWSKNFEILWCIFMDLNQNIWKNLFLILGRLFLDQSWSAIFWMVCQSFVAIGDWTGRTRGCHGAILGHAHVHYLRFAKNRHESSWTSACPGPASQKGNEQLIHAWDLFSNLFSPILQFLISEFCLFVLFCLIKSRANCQISQQRHL